jgi:hypothetical protein
MTVCVRDICVLHDKCVLDRLGNATLMRWQSNIVPQILDRTSKYKLNNLGSNVESPHREVQQQGLPLKKNICGVTANGAVTLPGSMVHDQHRQR